jgi:ankyrin repeat protein
MIQNSLIRFKNIINTNLDKKNITDENYKKRILNKILLDMEESEIFSPIIFEDDDDDSFLDKMNSIDDIIFKKDGDKSNNLINKVDKKIIKMSKKPEFIQNEGESKNIENKEFPYGRTPLHQAVALKNIELIKKYVDEKKYIFDVDNNGNTPYDMAYQEGYNEALNILKNTKNKV